VPSYRSFAVRFRNVKLESCFAECRFSKENKIDNDKIVTLTLYNRIGKHRKQCTVYPSNKVSFISE
jgi:hypothetical protein